ncbi:MAG: hypothetical protein IT454_10065, partial [Planctomycetes bacterium]|nr:hypothetical protein [Planctomycetota bacterium]
RADIVVLVSSAGELWEWAKYSAYGVPFGMPAGDCDSDGDCDAADVTTLTGWIGGAYQARGDLDLDGDVDSTDQTLQSNFSGTSLGRGVLTNIDNRKGYAGYELDWYRGRQYHVRRRVHCTPLGRWLNRDPWQHRVNTSLVEYVESSPQAHVDPTGLVSEWATNCTAGEPGSPSTCQNHAKSGSPCTGSIGVPGETPEQGGNFKPRGSDLSLTTWSAGGSSVPGDGPVGTEWRVKATWAIESSVGTGTCGNGACRISFYYGFTIQYKTPTMADWEQVRCDDSNRNGVDQNGLYLSWHGDNCPQQGGGTTAWPHWDHPEGQITDGNSNPFFKDSPTTANIPCPSNGGGIGGGNSNCSNYGSSATGFDGTHVTVDLLVCCGCGG